MLIRAYRLTDRFGIVILKSSIALADALFDGLSLIWRAIARVLRFVLGGVVRVVLRPLFALLAGIGLFLLNGGLGLLGFTRRQAAQTGTNVMARRAARAELGATIREDPLKRQNRALSAMTVALLLVLLVVVLWATSPSRQAAPISAAVVDSSLAGLAAAETVAPTSAVLQATAVPTATPLPSILEVRGTMAYVARERGQSDVWVVPVGSRAPLRLTGDPADERDPAWSPDGRRLAYSSRQDGNWELYVYDVTSGETTRMTYDLSFQGAPAWSPDGNWLVYESYQGNNLDVYIMRSDGSEPPIRMPGNSDAPDFSPAWSPDEREIAFVSWRDGNQDIYVFSLDEQAVRNITQTSTRHEDYPAWSPDAERLAYSALDAGLEKVFVMPVDDANATAQVIDRGRAPAWSPDGSSLVSAVDTVDGTQLVVTPFAGSGVGTAIIPVALGASDPAWSRATLPAALINSGGAPSPVPDALYVEQESRLNADPPYRLNTIGDVTVEQAVLSDRVNDSFIALREAVLEHAGFDFFGRLDDAFWRIERPRQPGEEYPNWLMSGRAFGITRNAIAGFPPPIEVQREDLGVDTYWRVYLRVADDAQSGQLGEPLRRMPWDFASRTQGDVEAYDQGGRLKASIPEGYYVDLTQIALDYGWARVPAGNDWRANSNSINYWLFQKRDGLTWFEAMREIYAEAQLGGYVPTATPAPDEPTGETAAGQ
jgi:TolB protein